MVFKLSSFAGRISQAHWRFAIKAWASRLHLWFLFESFYLEGFAIMRNVIYEDLTFTLKWLKMNILLENELQKLL